MTIIHVVEAFAGGIAVFVKSLVQGMPGEHHIIIHGERAEVNTIKEIQKNFPTENVEFVRWTSVQRNVNPIKDFSASRQLYTILSKLKQNNNADAVHLHSSKSGFIGRIVCRLLNIRNVVYTPNGAPFLVSRSKMTNYIYKQFEKLGSLFGGMVVCCSPSELKEYEMAGIKAININNGISPTNATVQPVHGSTFRVLTSGRVLDQKNPELFNEIAMYFEEFKQFEFIWVGDGPDRSVLKSSNIKITGWLTPDKVLKYVESADLYLSTAKFEGLPFSVLEALSLHKPVLLSDCVGNRDLVMSGANGSLFQHANQAIENIIRFYNNPDMLAIMGDQSADYCKNSFNANDTRDQYRNLYLTGNKTAVA